MTQSAYEILTLLERHFQDSVGLVRSICLKEKLIENSTSKSAGEKRSKTGGSDPTFSAFSRPKSSWGRSRPFFAPANKSRKPERYAPRLHSQEQPPRHDDMTESRIKACVAGPQEGNGDTLLLGR
jgi:hypothetical protein